MSIKDKSWIVIVICAIALLLIFLPSNNIPREPSEPTDFAGQAIHPVYPAFGTTIQSFNAPNSLTFTSTDTYKTLSFSINDNAVYKIAYISINGSAWQPITLTGNPLGGNWLKEYSSTTINIPRNNIRNGTSNNNYLIMYTCTKIGTTWDCHDNRWQLKEFATQMQEAACTTNCVNKQCGSNGCDGTCGTCTNLHGTTTCTVAGICQPTCSNNYADCDGNTINGCETILGTITNCASCGNTCGAEQICSGNMCSSVSCSGSTTQSCNITNGAGIQSRTCNSGVWSGWSTCTVTSCTSGYFINGSVCSSTSCFGSTTRSCNITNGIGSQSRTCTNGVWSAYNTCTVTSCNTGYTQNGNTCVVYTPPSTTGAIIADHNAARNFDNIPACWFDRARSQISVVYHHTSHGSQIPAGMDYLVNHVNPTLYEYDSFFSDNYDTDVGNGNWPEITRVDLNNNPSFNNVMWSWCGQVSDHPTYSSMSSHYLAPAESIVDDYGIDFVYMTGHLDSYGTGPEGNVYIANNIIRQHVQDIDGILFDFADIESYDPDGNYYPYDTDACNWCDDWCAAHPADCATLPSSCAHSHPFNCVQKARAYWWMAARLAGWDGVSQTCN